MAYADFSGREIVQALQSMGYRPIARKGSHVKLRYEHPGTEEVRVVSVPLTDGRHLTGYVQIDRRTVRSH